MPICRHRLDVIIRKFSKSTLIYFRLLAKINSHLKGARWSAGLPTLLAFGTTIVHLLYQLKSQVSKAFSKLTFQWPLSIAYQQIFSRLFRDLSVWTAICDTWKQCTDQCGVQANSIQFPTWHLKCVIFQKRVSCAQKD